MWVYEQSSGKFTHIDDVSKKTTFRAVGYSGRDEGKNNPALEAVQGVGPIPCGDYSISSKAFDSPEHGPLCLRLTPWRSDVMHGRSGFLIHGDSIKHPGTASRGCIILPRSVRALIVASGDEHLRVESGNWQKTQTAFA